MYPDRITKEVAPLHPIPNTLKFRTLHPGIRKFSVGRVPVSSTVRILLSFFGDFNN